MVWARAGRALAVNLLLIRARGKGKESVTRLRFGGIASARDAVLPLSFITCKVGVAVRYSWYCHSKEE